MIPERVGASTRQKLNNKNKTNEKNETENTCRSLINGSNGKNDIQEVDKSIPALPRNDVEVFLQGLSTESKIETLTANNCQSPKIYLNETIQPQSNSFLTSGVNSDMSRSIDIDFNQSEINNESNQPITMFVSNGLDQSDIVNKINSSMATFELENLNQSSVCYVDSTSFSPATTSFSSTAPSLEMYTTSPSSSSSSDSSINNEVFPCEVLETPNKDVQRVAKNFVQNYNKSKFENGSRRTNKKSKIGKNPDVTLFLEEDYLLHEVVERRNMYGNMIIEFAVKHVPDIFTMHFLNPEKGGVLLEQFLEGNSFAKPVMCEMDNLLIPDSLGKFAKGFVSVLYEHTYKAEGHFTIGIYYQKGKQVANAYEQEVESLVRVEPETASMVKQIYDVYSDEKPFSYETTGIFTTPWCYSYEDELFYMNTIQSLAQIANEDTKVKSLIFLLILTRQPPESPFYKKKNIRALSNYITTLLYRYLSSLKGSSQTASTMVANIVKCIQQLGRCVDIFDNSRLKLDANVSQF